MFSPPKRRKTSDITAVAVGAPDFVAPHNETRSPHRPSFQSPTRSSLAKSHPEVLQRALSRSPGRRPASRESQEGYPEQSNSRSVGLRDRKALRPSLGGTSSPLKAPQVSSGTPTLSPSKSLGGIQSFSKPPRRLSRKILPTDFTFGSPVGKRAQPVEQDLSNTPEGQLALELGSATRESSREEPMDTNLDVGFMDGDPLEPDLPPTPTQLGLEKAPDRPRGLLSSSPSTRHEKRVRRRTADVLKGSPLKSLNFYPPAPDEGPDDKGSSQEAPSTAVSGKRRMRNNLLAELRKLREDVSDLTKWTEKVESDENLEDDSRELDKILKLLLEESSYMNRPVPRRAPVPVSSLLSTLLPFSINLPRPSRPISPLPTNPFALENAQYSPYLTLFAPLTLRTHTSRLSASQTNSLLETHTLTFTAPSPFPSNLYNVSVVYGTNPETQSLISLSVSTGAGSKKRKVPEPLRRWVDSRLSNPLLKLDVTTVCWGINRFWEVSLARAQLWARVEHKYGKIASSRREIDAVSEPQSGIVTLSGLKRLIPHLERSTMLVMPNSSSAAPQVLLSNPLTMEEWTGEPQIQPELSVSASGIKGAPNKNIDQEAKKLFHALLREEGSATSHTVGEGIHVDAILRATEGALGALFGGC
ncbi:uncharacterized protein N7459_006073 [Penicillium hispanicum]|uniref:uncharacterized protein n=1 Tax=Penicillium hispanicum TaxID=1080232 RepID=UPI00253FEDF1|nr:uncharacterized protein N7459_006073 [Penicillium hispanicum]KAJ5580088.1 hypothetical protein N7459_006073 [Penicillium hispanicum]